MADSRKIVEIIYKLNDQASTKIKGLGSGFLNLGKNILSSKLSLAALTGLFVVGIKDFADLQTSVSNAGTLFGATTDQVKDLTAEIIEMSTRVPAGAKDLSDSLFDVLSAGVSVNESMAFLESASELAIAGVTSTGVAVDGLTSLMNAYGLKASEVTTISDLLFQAQKEGKTTVEQLSNSIGNVAPIAASLKVPMGELLGQVAALTKNGIATSEAVTGVRSTMVAFAKQTTESRKIAKKLGIEFSASAVKSKGLTKVLKEVIKATGGNEEMLMKLFGRVEAVNSVIALSKNGFEDLDEVLNSVERSTGSTSEAYELQAKTMVIQTALLKNNVLALSRAFFDKLEPSITAVISKMNEMLSSGMKTELEKLNSNILDLEEDYAAVEQKIKDTTTALKEAYDFTKPLYEKEIKRLNRKKEILGKNIQQYKDEKAVLEWINNELDDIEDGQNNIADAVIDTTTEINNLDTSVETTLDKIGNIFDKIKFQSSEAAKDISINLIDPITDFIMNLGKAVITPGGLEKAAEDAAKNYLIEKKKAEIYFEKGMITKAEKTESILEAAKALNESMIEIKAQADVVKGVGGLMNAPEMWDADQALQIIRDLEKTQLFQDIAKVVKGDYGIAPDPVRTNSFSTQSIQSIQSNQPTKLDISGKLTLTSEGGQELAKLTYEQQTELLKNGEISERR